MAPKPERVIAYRILVGLFLCAAALGSASAGGKAGLYGIRMVPIGDDAESYSDPSWGMGFHVVYPLGNPSSLFALTGGVEFVFLQTNFIYEDPITGVKYDPTEDPNYWRVYFGGQIGGHGNGFLRPHVGAGLSLSYYYYPEGIVVFTEQVGSGQFSVSVSEKFAFGFDLTAGLDLNFSNTIALDFGAKYLNVLAVTTPNGGSSLTIYPQYFQLYAGIGYSLDFLNEE